MVVKSKTAVYGILTAGILRSNFGIFYDETYGTMTKYDDGDDDGDNDRNENGNNNNNAASGSGSDGLIFDLINTP